MLVGLGILWYDASIFRRQDVEGARLFRLAVLSIVAGVCILTMAIISPPGPKDGEP
jgi:hypothetical protein